MHAAVVCSLLADTLAVVASTAAVPDASRATMDCLPAANPSLPPAIPTPPQPKDTPGTRSNELTAVPVDPRHQRTRCIARQDAGAPLQAHREDQKDPPPPPDTCNQTQ
ncbi:uncharacterized protein AB9W97_014282 [Spinachia spinachia]